MKIARLIRDGREEYGFVFDEEVVLAGTVRARLGIDLPEELEDFASKAEEVTTVEGRISEILRLEREPLRNFRLAAPIRNPPKILGLGLNYADHAAEQNLQPPEYPPIFFKPATTINGPYDDVLCPAWASRQLDYEIELGVVMGRKGRNIPAEKALEHVLGYVILSDVSARDIQKGEVQWTRGKAFDTFAPIGPWIATSAQVGDPQNLAMKTLVNEEVRQNSSTNRMTLTVARAIEYYSRVFTFQPLDIIATGTPAGVGIWAKPEPKFLKDGDVMEMTIEKIGTIRNRIVIV